MAIPSETINTTHDKNWDYKKVILEDGTVEYFFIGSRGKYKQNFPNWVKTVDDGGSGTIRRNAIMVGVFGDSLDPTSQNETPINKIFKTPPETSQTSNIIENSEDPNANNLYGTVVDEKTLEPIKGADISYGTYSTVTNEKGEFVIELPTPKSSQPTILQECINTKHDSAYNYKRLTYSDGKIDYYFIGKTGIYKRDFPNWTEAPPDTLIGKTSGTINRDAIVEKVVFDCPPVKFEESSSLNENIDTPPTPVDIPINPSSQLRPITGELQVSDVDPGATNYNGLIRLVKNDIGDITDPPYQTNTDFDGKFKLSVPIDGKFIQARKPNSTQTIILPLTQETNYVFDFSSQVSNGVILEQEETTVVASRVDLEASAIDYESKSIPVIKGDGTLKNNLGFIPLKTTKADLDKEIIESVTPTEEEIQTVTKDKKDFKFRLNQKLIDLLNKLKNVLLPIILTMIAKFGITKIQEQLNKNGDDIKEKFCPPKEELDKIIKRKNKLVKQLNNTLKVIESTTKALGIVGNVILVFEIAFKVLKDLPLPTSVPPGVGLPTNFLLGIQDNKDKINKTITSLKLANTGTLIVLTMLKTTLSQIITYLNLLDSLIQNCYPEAEQEQLSAELVALTQEQANQESPVVTIVNGFTMGVETEKTTNSLKRRRATATNAGGVVMLKGEWSFSSIDQILIDELVFYIQINDLKAD